MRLANPGQRTDLAAGAPTYSAGRLHRRILETENEILGRSKFVCMASDILVHRGPDGPRLPHPRPLGVSVSHGNFDTYSEYEDFCSARITTSEFQNEPALADETALDFLIPGRRSQAQRAPALQAERGSMKPSA